MIKITSEYGLIIRRDSLIRENITEERICEIMEVKEPMDSNSTLISFGPHYDEEAAGNFLMKLEKEGLRYVEDFFIFFGDFPEWIQFDVKLISPNIPIAE